MQRHLLLPVVCDPDVSRWINGRLRRATLPLLYRPGEIHVVILQQFSNFFPPMRSNAFLK
jgi:hypothetical protein